MILNGIHPSPLAPTSKLSYSDVTVGIPMMANCLLMVPFAIFFHWAYDVKSYHLPSLDEELRPMYSAARQLRYEGGRLGLKAWLWIWNPKEIISASLFSFAMFSESKKVCIRNQDHVYEQSALSTGLGPNTCYESHAGGYNGN